jgi:hypothetical protein
MVFNLVPTSFPQFEWYDVLCILLAVGCAYLGSRSGYGLWYLLSGIHRLNRRQTQLIEPIPALPDELAETDAQLRSLGFSPLFVTNYVLSQHNQPSQPQQVWHYLHHEEPMIAEIESYSTPQTINYISLITWFPDEAIIVTMYPQGEYIVRDEKLHSRFASKSLMAAFDYQREQQTRWTPLHGEPVRNNTFAQAKQYGERFAKLYSYKFSMRNVKRLASATLSWYGIALLWLIIPVLIRLVEGERQMIGVILAVTLPLMILIFAIGLVVDRRLSYVGPPVDWQPDFMDWTTDVKVEKKDS